LALAVSEVEFRHVLIRAVHDRMPNQQIIRFGVWAPFLRSFTGPYTSISGSVRYV